MTAAIAEKKLVIAQKRYTLEEYLVREERSKHKHAYINGEIILMPGSKSTHNEIAINTASAIKVAGKKNSKKFRVLSSDQKIYIAQLDDVLYPDLLVIFETIEYWKGREDLVINPLLIVEVASRSTSKYDKEEKFLKYPNIPSFKEYVIINQFKPRVESFFKLNDKHWDLKIETDLTGKINLRSLGLDIELADIYENIVFKPSSKKI